jgi:hypothetical protein
LSLTAQEEGAPQIAHGFPCTRFSAVFLSTNRIMPTTLISSS